MRVRRVRLIIKFSIICLLVLLGYVQRYQASYHKEALVLNHVYVRQAEKYVLECEPEDGSLQLLHTAYIKPGTRHLRRLMASPIRGGLSHVYGFYMSHPCSEKQIESFMHNFGFYRTGYGWRAYNKEIASKAEKFGVVPSEWVVPKEGFKNFNQFFTRRLKDGVRPIANGSNVVVSPADSKLFVIEHIQARSRFFDIKSDSFSLESFLQDDKRAREYEGGTLLIFRLSPYNYHRYHFPLSCTPSRSIKIDGSYESVHPVVYKVGINPLITNKRKIVQLKTVYGNVLMGIVGAFNVGRICNTFFAGEQYKKGYEAGYFEFGASTITLLFKPGAFKVDRSFLHNSQRGHETVVVTGERVGVMLSRIRKLKD